MARRHIALADAGPTVESVMYSGPRTLAATASVAEARTELEHPRTAVVLVCDGERFVGTITAAELEEQIADDVPARAIARADSARLDPDDPIEDALALHREQGTSRIPVVDGAGSLRGLVCFTRAGDSFCVFG
jgi:CBS domain-containing protein